MFMAIGASIDFESTLQMRQRWDNAKEKQANRHVARKLSRYVDKRDDTKPDSENGRY